MIARGRLICSVGASEPPQAAVERGLNTVDLAASRELGSACIATSNTGRGLKHATTCLRGNLCRGGRGRGRIFPLPSKTLQRGDVFERLLFRRRRGEGDLHGVSACAHARGFPVRVLFFNDGGRADLPRYARYGTGTSTLIVDAKLVVLRGIDAPCAWFRFRVFRAAG